MQKIFVKKKKKEGKVNELTNSRKLPDIAEEIKLKRKRKFRTWYTREYKAKLDVTLANLQMTGELVETIKRKVIYERSSAKVWGVDEGKILLRQVVIYQVKRKRKKKIKP